VNHQADDALRGLNERYFHAVDERDLDAVGACFALDATCVYLGGAWRLSGRRAIMERLSVINTWLSTVHSPATMSFTARQNGAAGVIYAVAHLMTAGDGESRRITVRGLKYSDHYARVSGEWLIAERRQEALWQYEVPAIPAALPGQGPEDASR
jgi:ketosteroid isomerase-like protein